MISELRILTERVRLYSKNAKFMRWARDSENETEETKRVKEPAPIKFTKNENTELRKVIEQIETKCIEFLCEFRSSEITELIEKYNSPKLNQGPTENWIEKYHESLNHVSSEDMYKYFNNRDKYTQKTDDLILEDDDDFGKMPQSKEIDKYKRLIPKILSKTSIMKLGSKKDGFQNKQISRFEFFKSIPSYTNKSSSDFYYVCNMLIGFSGVLLMNMISHRNHEINFWFHSYCDELEFKHSNASCKRCIKTENLVKPVIAKTLSI